MSSQEEMAPLTTTIAASKFIRGRVFSPFRPIGGVGCCEADRATYPGGSRLVERLATGDAHDGQRPPGPGPGPDVAPIGALDLARGGRRRDGARHDAWGRAGGRT